MTQRERICLQCRRCGFNPWAGKVPWRRIWQPAPIFLPGKSHGQRSLVGCNPKGLEGRATKHSCTPAPRERAGLLTSCCSSWFSFLHSRRENHPDTSLICQCVEQSTSTQHVCEIFFTCLEQTLPVEKSLGILQHL